MWEACHTAAQLMCLLRLLCCSYGAPASLEAYYQQVGLQLTRWLKLPTCCVHIVFCHLKHSIAVRHVCCNHCNPQAGRAGRDGVQSSCVLLWSAADAAKNAIIKVRVLLVGVRIRSHRPRSGGRALCLLTLPLCPLPPAVQRCAQRRGGSTARHRQRRHHLLHPCARLQARLHVCWRGSG